MSESLTTRILIEIRDEIRGTNRRFDEHIEKTERQFVAVGARLDATNQRLGVLAKITEGIHTRMERLETTHGFLPCRVDVLETRVEKIEKSLADGPPGPPRRPRRRPTRTRS